MNTITRHTVLLLAVLVALATLTACGSDREDEGVIRIGIAVSETGRFAAEGGHTRRGYLLWEDWVNEEYGGIKVGGERYRAELIIYDDQSDPDTTAELVERLIDADRVDFMLGPYGSHAHPGRHRSRRGARRHPGGRAPALPKPCFSSPTGTSSRS